MAEGSAIPLETRESLSPAGKSATAVLERPVSAVELPSLYPTEQEPFFPASTVESQRSLAHYTNLTNEQIRALPLAEYTRYLSLLTMGTRQTIIESLRRLPIIATRFGTDIETLTSSQNPSEEAQAAAQKTGTYVSLILEEVAEKAKAFVEPETIEKLYVYTRSENPFVRLSALGYVTHLFEIDHFDTQVGIEDQFRKDFLEDLEHPRHPNSPDIDAALASAGAYVLYDIQTNYTQEKEDIVLATLRAADTSQTTRITRMFAHAYGLEYVLKTLREAANHDPTLQKKYDAVQQIFLPSETQGYSDLQKLYHDIIESFKKYKPNQELMDFEKDLLLQFLPDDGKTLVFGAGLGREAAVLAQNGRDVEGFDMVPEHIAEAEKLHPELIGKLKVASWPNTGYPSRSFKGISFLGRSFLHNATIQDARACLGEVERLLEDDGVALVDLPDITKGNYKKERIRFAKATARLDVRHESGAIFDSPNGTQYFPRLAPTEWQFQAMCTLNNLKAKKIAEKPYHGHDGTENTNTYWRLTKHKASEYEIETAFDQLDDEEFDLTEEDFAA